MSLYVNLANAQAKIHLPEADLSFLEIKNSLLHIYPLPLLTAAGGLMAW